MQLSLPTFSFARRPRNCDKPENVKESPSESCSPKSPEQMRWSQIVESDRLKPEKIERFHSAEDMEKGLADEEIRVQSAGTPVTRGSSFHRYSVLWKAETGHYHMLSDRGVFVLAARFFPESGRIDISTDASPPDGDGASPSAPTRGPSYVMDYCESLDEWILMKSRCDFCIDKPRQLTCAYVGKGQQLARMRHSKRHVKKVQVHHLDVALPPLIGGRESAVWCPLFTGRDVGTRGSSRSSPSSASLASPLSRVRSPIGRGYSGASSPNAVVMLPGEEDEDLHFDLITPIWDEEVECLVLTFEGRTAYPSARNFKLKQAGDSEEKEVIFQHVKLNNSNMWCIDFRHPLSAVQAFGIALSSIDWD